MANGRFRVAGAMLASPRVRPSYKEIDEEAGLKTRATRLLAFFDKRKHDHPFQLPHAYKCFFLCEEIGGELLEGTLETSEARFFPLSELPPLSLHRVTKPQIERISVVAADNKAQAAFD